MLPSLLCPGRAGVRLLLPALNPSLGYCLLPLPHAYFLSSSCLCLFALPRGFWLWFSSGRIQRVHPPAVLQCPLGHTAGTSRVYCWGKCGINKEGIPSQHLPTICLILPQEESRCRGNGPPVHSSPCFLAKEVASTSLMWPGSHSPTMLLPQGACSWLCAPETGSLAQPLQEAQRLPGTPSPWAEPSQSITQQEQAAFPGPLWWQLAGRKSRAEPMPPAPASVSPLA